MEGIRALLKIKEPPEFDAQDVVFVTMVGQDIVGHICGTNRPIWNIIKGNKNITFLQQEFLSFANTYSM